jgi:hypothetical protein
MLFIDFFVSAPMKTVITLCALMAPFLTTCAADHQQIRVNVTGTAPAEFQEDKQPLTVFTCGGQAFEHHMRWQEDNPIELPFGWQGEGEGRYFISQYYIASPPLPNQFVADTPLILGVLSEDHFVVNDPARVVTVDMDYRLLEPVKLGFMPVAYGGFGEQDSCVDLQVNHVPINIRCPEFTYTPYGRAKTGASKGLGKGIGMLSRKPLDGGLSDEGQLFIPLHPESEVALEGCTVEVVNDILLHHQVSFVTAHGPRQTLDLSQAYRDFQRSGQPVGLWCRARPADQPAAGCQPAMPERVAPDPVL